MSQLPPRRYRPHIAQLLAGEEQQAALTGALSQLDARLDEFAALETGWDSYTGLPLSAGAAALARALIRELVDDPAKAPQLVPLSDAGVQLEWYAAGYDIEITIAGDETVEVYLEQPDGSVHEGRLSKRMRQMIAAALNVLAQHDQSGLYSVWCATTNNLLAEVATAEQAIAVAEHDPDNLIVFAPSQTGQPAPVIYDRRNRPKRDPIQYESEIVVAADGDRSLVMHELPQLFRRSVVEQAIDALEHADETVEALLEALADGEVRPYLIKRAQRVRKHRLQRAIRELRVEAGWDEARTER